MWSKYENEYEKIFKVEGSVEIISGFIENI